MDHVKQTEEKFKQIIQSFEDELKGIHTGRAYAGLIEDIKVNHYNSVMPLKQLASISTEGPLTLVVRPWDPGALQPIETAMREAGRNLNPSNDGAVVHVNLPPLSGERREELIRLLNRQAEAARVGLRNIREETWRQVKEAEQASAITQDDRYRLEKELNRLIADYNQKVEGLMTAKQQSISS